MELKQSYQPGREIQEAQADMKRPRTKEGRKADRSGAKVPETKSRSESPIHERDQDEAGNRDNRYTGDHYLVLRVVGRCLK